MSCSHCGGTLVAFVVPDALREYAPARESAICNRCLRTVAGSDAAGAADPDAAGETAVDLSSVDPAFPEGEAGVALALVCGLLESYALNRPAIEALLAHAEREGADVFLFFDRLDGSTAAFDLDRRRAALLDGL
ncbi:hypothetical protein GRS48_14225 [Halorubrum sp. JWXQ-INN 858]|uniref:DUF6276 family protein n=1 Tax=Halorubrum sp. JWXQ-INN 858 TaxID=2690782 RepID=UPI00135A0EED|nr:DUF6276 family protein [Halorubrum sp. JWXQ-INN 858]MWV65965.1 hypothetical protein [Halorubrum sp. JWXQ-INN 858]